MLERRRRTVVIYDAQTVIIYNVPSTSQSCSVTWSVARMKKCGLAFVQRGRDERVLEVFRETNYLFLSLLATMSNNKWETYLHTLRAKAPQKTSAEDLILKLKTALPLQNQNLIHLNLSPFLLTRPQTTPTSRLRWYSMRREAMMALKDLEVRHCKKEACTIT